MSTQKIIGTQIFKYGNLTVHQVDCGSFIISNGSVHIVKDTMPQLDVKPLLSLLIDKATLTDCFITKQPVAPSNYGNEVFNSWFKKQTELHEAYLMGY